MGVMDNFKDKARDAAETHRDKIDKGLDKAAELANKKTGGQHADKIDQVVERGKDALDRMDEPNARPDQPNGGPSVGQPNDRP